MKNVKEYFKPATPEEAIRLFREQPGKGEYIAGGTQVAAAKDPSNEYLVDLTCCGLNGIQEQDGHVCIGACTTLEELLQSDLIGTFASGILAEVACWTGSRQRRNSATVGANLVLQQELALPLLALEAQLVIAGDGERTVSLSEFYTSNGNILQNGELITACRVPGEFREAVANVQRMNRTRQDVPLISVAAVTLVNEGVCQKARLAVAPVVCGITRVASAEAILEQKPVTKDVISNAVEALTHEVQPVDDYRASAGYRQKMFGVYTTRALGKCFHIGE